MLVFIHVYHIFTICLLLLIVLIILPNTRYKHTQHNLCVSGREFTKPNSWVNPFTIKRYTPTINFIAKAHKIIGWFGTEWRQRILLICKVKSQGIKWSFVICQTSTFHTAIFIWNVIVLPRLLCIDVVYYPTYVYCKQYTYLCACIILLRTYNRVCI